MKEVRIKIPEKKYKFFMELLRQLGMEVIEETHIPEDHKAIVRKRISTTLPEEYIPWEKARKQLILKKDK